MLVSQQRPNSDKEQTVPPKHRANSRRGTWGFGTVGYDHTSAYRPVLQSFASPSGAEMVWVYDDTLPCDGPTACQRKLTTPSRVQTPAPASVGSPSSRLPCKLSDRVGRSSPLSALSRCLRAGRAYARNPRQRAPSTPPPARVPVRASAPIREETIIGKLHAWLSSLSPSRRQAWLYRRGGEHSPPSTRLPSRVVRHVVNPQPHQLPPRSGGPWRGVMASAT